MNSIQELQTLILKGESDWLKYGDVRVSQRGDLLQFTYTKAAQYNARWNWFERVSRGLIMNAKTGEVVARPFDKFFNWSEGGRKSRAHIVDITEKLDGSLGILYRENGAYRIATRGNFESEQALWATEFLNQNYDLSDLDPDLTLLFEIIYPENRIVVDYGDREDLVLVGVRNRHTGDEWPFYPDMYELAERFGFTLPQVYHFNSITDILAATDDLDANSEGWVIRFADGQRFKIKGDRYIELHRLVTQATFNQVLKATASGQLEMMIADVPDEFLSEIKIWQAEIAAKVKEVKARVELAFSQAPKGDDRKTFALWVREHHPGDAHYLFATLDGRDITDLIYKSEF